MVKNRKKLPHRKEVQKDDLAIISRRSVPERVVTVERVTPTQFLAGGFRWRLKDGYQVGGSDSWHQLRIEVKPSAEALERAETQIAAKRVRESAYQISQCTTSKLRTVGKINLNRLLVLQAEFLQALEEKD